MGLDMYLDRVKKLPNLSLEEVRKLEDVIYSKVYDWQDIMKKYKDFVVVKKYGDKEYYMFSETGIYWRKVNCVHDWFVQNVQDGEDDCGVYEVSIEILKELKDICEQVLEDNNLAEELLPTTSGFFFGSTEYDEYYFEDLKETVENIDNLLSSYDEDKEFLTYGSSW